MHTRLATNYDPSLPSPPPVYRVKCHQSIVNHLILACIIVYGRHSHSPAHPHTCCLQSPTHTPFRKPLKTKGLSKQEFSVPPTGSHSLSLSHCPCLKAKLRNVFWIILEIEIVCQVSFSLYLMANRLAACPPYLRSIPIQLYAHDSAPCLCVKTFVVGFVVGRRNRSRSNKQRNSYIYV